jgi:hypothetical protein
MWLFPIPVIFTGAGNCSGAITGAISAIPGIPAIPCAPAVQHPIPVASTNAEANPMPEVKANFEVIADLEVGIRPPTIPGHALVTAPQYTRNLP